MGGSLSGFLQGRTEAFKVPFCREEELVDTIRAIRSEDCRAVFLTSDSGLGASTILAELAKAARDSVPVLTLHGSQSLARIPFGVLTPYLKLQEISVETIRLSVLRQLLQAIDARQNELGNPAAGSGDLPLVVVDDAHAIDEGSAELLVSLVLSGAINIVASHSKRHRMPDPLPKLWATGLAENIVLRPLSRQQGHDFCAAMLGGPVLPATSWHYWSTSAGNPLFLRLVINEALEMGQLRLREGKWVAEAEPRLPGRALEDAVRGALRGLSAEGKEALDLVALAEPLAEPELRGLVSAGAVQELLHWSVIKRQPPASELLVLANPIYGQVIRGIVPVARSRKLYGQLIGDLTHAGGSRESLLRRVLWAVEVGMEVSDEALLRAAILASQLYQPATALHLAQEINNPDFQLRATMVKARAKYNLGDYRGAFTLMELLQTPADVEDLIFGALLRAATRSALGMPVEMLRADAQDLRSAAATLALAGQDKVETILAQAHSSALMVELMALSRTGEYAAMGQATAQLLAQPGLPVTAQRRNRTLALAMDSELLTAQGYPEQGAWRAAQASALEHVEENDVFFMSESVLLRHVTAMLCAGHWSGASELMGQFGMEDGPIVSSFGGAANVVSGMILVRAGQFADALTVLRAGIDSLQCSDPQQLMGYCTAMAAYCAAHLGQHTLAAKLVNEHVESTRMYLILAHERAYLAATRQLLSPDGAGLAELMAQAGLAQESKLAMMELNALVLALELGDEGVAHRVAEVAAGVEGPWARGLCLYATALHALDGQGLKDAGIYLTGAGLAGLAKAALAKSHILLKGGGLKGTPDTARQRLQALPAQPGGGVPPKTSSNVRTLTRRERQIAGLARAGLSDREIAGELSLALRTVEGHLYRAYAKLGVSTREELARTL